MKTKEKYTTQGFCDQLAIIMPRPKHTQAQVNALAASILRGKEGK